MNRSKDLSSRLQELFIDGSWIANTNFNKVLENIKIDKACYQIEELNSIAKLTFHINYYVNGVLDVLKGGDLTIKDKYSFDLPPIQTDQEWLNLKKLLISNARELIGCVNNLTEAELDEAFVDQKYGSYQRNLEAIIEHGYYHLGQISLISKLVDAEVSRN